MQNDIVKFKNIEKILLFFLKLFLFMLPWQTIWIFRESFLYGVKQEYLTLGFYATEALLWIAFLCFMTSFVVRLHATGYRLQDFKWSKDRIFVLAVLSFIIYHLSSIFRSLDPHLALQQSLRVMEAFLLFFILLLGPLKKEEVIKWLALGSVLPCVLGIWQFLTQSTFASTWLGLASHPAWQGGTSVVASETIGRWLRAYGPFSHPNVFGGYLVIVLFFTYYISRITYQQNSFFGHVLRVMCYVLCVTLFFTFSRSAWVAAAVVITYHVSRIIRHVTRTTCHAPIVMCYVLCVTCYVFLIALFFPLVQTRLTGNSVSESYSISDRVSGYSDAWKLFKQNPIFGVGAGNYTVALWHSDKWRPAWQIQPAHNAVVLFVVEGGVVGVGLLAMIIITYHLSRTTYQRDRIVWYVLCGMCYVVLASFDHYLYSSYTGLMLSALFFGLILRKNSENTFSPQLVHCESFDTPDTACHNTDTRQEPTVGAGA